MSLHEVYQLFNECWKFYRKWADNGPLTDDQAAQVVKDAHAVSERFANERFAQDLVCVCVREIDRR